MTQYKAERYNEYLKDVQDSQDDLDYCLQKLIKNSKFLQDMEKKQKESIDEDAQRSRLVFIEKKKVQSLEMSKKRKLIMNETNNESEKSKTDDEDELASTKNELEETKKQLLIAQKELIQNKSKICKREGCGAIITSNNSKGLYCSKNQLCLNEKANRIFRAEKNVRLLLQNK